jgi:hypothetical protein
MNRTLLLFIVDFLFLNLIALTRWERAEPVRPKQPPVPEVAANSPTKTDDLVEAMRQSLAEEQAAQAELEQRLAYASNNAATREQSLSTAQAEKARLAASLADTQRQAAELSQQVAASSQEATMTKDQLAQLQRQLDEKNEEAERQSHQIADLQKAQSDARRQIEGLTVAVVVGEEEKQQLQQRATELQGQVQSERTERIKVQETTRQLAQGVGQLAQKSGELTQEIRENRPINANVLYNDFLTNRVDTDFTASRRGLFGTVEKSKRTPTVVIKTGGRYYALLDIEDTVFSLWNQNYDWEKIGVAFNHPSGAPVAAGEMDFLAADPRVVTVPIEASEVVALGAKPYTLARDPFKFPQAVLIDATGKGYGLVGFKLDPTEPGYVRVDNRFLNRLFGDFAPSRGDLVFSQTGELLGIMVNNNYCAVLKDMTPLATLQTGTETAAVHTGAFLDGLAARIESLPLDLQ